MTLTGAVADCESIVDPFVGQPVNSITALGFVAAGAVVWSRTRRPTLALALVATGLGSFLFHGPMPPGAEWAHDVSMVWLLAVVGLTGTRWQRWAGWPALAILGIVLALAPVGDLVGAVLATGAVGRIVWQERTYRTWTALSLVAIGAAVGRLSATGGPWCSPDSVLQGHGLWHLAAAGAVAVWADGTKPSPHPSFRR